MAESTAHPFFGVDTTHSSSYSVRRFCYFWDISGLSGRLEKIRVRVSLRSGNNLRNSNYNLCLFSDWTKPDGNNNWGWHKRNNSSWYQYPNQNDYYFTNATYSSFGTFLCNKPVTLSLTGGAGNTWQILDVIPDSEFLDASKWNKTIYLMFYDRTGRYSPELIWGTEQKNDIAFYTFDEPQNYVAVYDGSSWVKTKPHYYSAAEGGWKNVYLNYRINDEWQRICSHF